jgi:enoyl-CoA hydratase/carnithine racemase
MAEVVLFEELACDNQLKIGVVTLNSPRSLNALSGEMIDLLLPQLSQWKAKADIVAVFIQGEGEKAFCAGGDIVHMYNAMTQGRSAHEQNDLLVQENYTPERLEKLANTANSSDKIEAYFTKEYQLDYLIHTFEKPFIVWGNGIVMGGGLGLMVGGSHRIVTENSRIAMPEMGIGLYPDVGASYFLNKMKPGVGLFLGLTGASINAMDALYSKLADNFVEHRLKSDFVKALTQLPFALNDESTNEQALKANHDVIAQLINQLEKTSQVFLNANPIESQLSLYQNTIEKLTSYENLSEIIDAIKAEKTTNNWFIKAQQALSRGSALSAQITFKQLDLGKTMSLSECFKMELGLSVRSGQFGEFSEGVRALLIDKDNKPAWRFADVASVEPSVIEWFFENLWPEDESPLGF